MGRADSPADYPAYARLNVGWLRFFVRKHPTDREERISREVIELHMLQVASDLLLQGSNRSGVVIVLHNPSHK